MSAAGGVPLDRRRFLRRTLVGAGLLAVGGTVLRHFSGYRIDPATAASLRVLSPKESLVLAAVARRLLAADREGTPTSDDLNVVSTIDAYLAGVPAALSSDVRSLLQLLEHSPLLFAGRPARFTHLDAAAQDAVLADWETSRIDLRRRGFTALKNLCALGYYGDRRSHAILGYPGPLLPAG